MIEGKKGTQVVLDYAHHPAEIRVVLRAARRRFPARPIVAVFQPHQHSRTSRLLDDFVTVLAEADHGVVAEVYAARERLNDVETVTAARMVDAIRSRGARADVGAELSAMPAQVASQLLPNAVVLVLGAGNIDAILEPLLLVT